MQTIKTQTHGGIQMGGGGGGGQGVQTPLKNHNDIGCPSSTGQDPLKNHKATKPAFIVRPSSACQRKAI